MFLSLLWILSNVVGVFLWSCCGCCCVVDWIQSNLSSMSTVCERMLLLVVVSRSCVLLWLVSLRFSPEKRGEKREMWVKKKSNSFFPKFYMFCCTLSVLLFFVQFKFCWLSGVFVLCEQIASQFPFTQVLFVISIIGRLKRFESIFKS